jgi:hypothetical protein
MLTKVLTSSKRRRYFEHPGERDSIREQEGASGDDRVPEEVVGASTRAKALRLEADENSPLQERENSTL